MKTAMDDLISRQAVCDYCREDTDGYRKPIEKNSHILLSRGIFGWQIVAHLNGLYRSANVNYCPMCGRRLSNG